jgi:hypothetical protein
MINWSIDEENELIWIENLFVIMMLKKLFIWEWAKQILFKLGLTKPKVIWPICYLN